MGKMNMVRRFWQMERLDFRTDVPFSVVPVSFQKKEVLDDWHDPLKPLPSKYVSNFTVEYDTEYEIRVREGLNN